MTRRATIRRGSKGDDVAHAHGILGAHGFNPGPLTKTKLFNAAMHQALVHFQETHLDEDHVPLDVDGWAGPKTWWALEHPDGDDQSLGLTLAPALTEISSGLHGLSSDRIQLLHLAQGYHGVREVPNGSNRSEQIDAWTKWTDKRGRKGPPWCAFFASGIWHEHLDTWPLGGRIGSCYRSMKLASKKGLYLRSTDEVIVQPEPGDQFVMLYTDPAGKLTYRGHTGLVTAVSVDGNSIGTVEGNCANRVARRIRPVSSMHGFIRVLDSSPDFERGLPEGVKRIGGESTR